MSDTGLSAEEAYQLDWTRYGPNVLLETGRIPWYVVFGRQFVDISDFYI